MAEAPPAPSRDPAAPPRRRHLGRWIGGAVGLVLLAVLAVAGAAAWVLTTAAGTAWALGHAPYIEVEGPSGALLGDFAARRLVVRPPGRADTITLLEPAWRRLRIVRAAAPLWAAIRLDALTIRRLDLVLAPSPPTSAPTKPPTSLRVPVEVEIAALQITEVHGAGLGDAPIRDLRAALHLGAGAGSEHRLERLALAWEQLRLTGSARLGTDGTLPLAVRLDATQAAAGALPGIALQATLDGPLAGPAVEAHLRTEAGAPPARASEPQTLDLKAVVHPFAAWPIGALQASTHALDLSALSAALPETALDGSAAVASVALDQPASIRLDLTNARAGRWNEGRLPVRRAQAEIGARPDRPSELEIRTLSADLGSDAAPAGRIDGHGRWSPTDWSFDATLAALRPALLDARAPAMALGGSLEASRVGPLEAPITLKAALTGALAELRAARDVRLRLEATLAPNQVAVRTFDASAAGTRATLAGTLARASAEAPWVARAKAALVDFDPAVWWPGSASPGRGTPATRLNAQAEIDLSLPPNPPASSAKPADPLAAALAQLRGQATVTLADSSVAGVPMNGTARLKSAGGAGTEVDLRLDAAGNRVTGQGRLATSGSGSTDTIDLAIEAPALDALAPALRGWRPATGTRPLAGRLAGQLHLRGRWPAVTTEGRLDASDLRLATSILRPAQAEPGTAAPPVEGGSSTSVRAASVAASRTPPRAATARPARGERTSTVAQVRRQARSPAPAEPVVAPRATPLRQAVEPADEVLEMRSLSARWSLGSSLDARLDANLSVADASLATAGTPGPSLESATLALTGSARAHALAVHASTKARPPAWSDALQGGVPTTPANRTLALLEADGGFVEVPGQPLAGWRGRLRQLDLRSDAAGALPLVRAQDIALDLRWPAAAAATFAVQPGRAVLLGSALRWSRIAWQAAGPAAASRLDADAELEPLRVAPLLAALQPGFGWGGDLTLGGRLHIVSQPTLRAEIAIERRDGDLTITDEFGTRVLGLSRLALGLTANDGLWRFTETLDGTAIGRADGAQTVRADPHAIWPAADAPLDGTFALKVDDLGNWGGFLPPGWRLGGALDANARIAGRFGAPDYTGRVDGRGLFARNFLQGVLVTDGDLGVRLQGATAHIERFTAKAGTGSVRIEGDASFGDAPRALLDVRAEHFQLLGRVDRRVATSGSARLQIDAKTLGLSGRFDVDDGLIDFTHSDAPALGDDVTVIRAAGTPSPAAAASAAATPDTTRPLPVVAAPKRDVALDLRVGLGTALRIRGRGLDAGLRGDLRITSPGGRLAVAGAVRVEDGTYDAYGQKLGIDRGVVTFAGNVDNPRLDIEATRRDLDIRVGVIVTGTPADLRVRLFSEPDLSDIDKISYLVLGHASDGNDTALLQRAALALLSGEGGGGVSDRLTKALGLDEISFRQGDNGLRDAVVGIGKQISKRWYVGYERGLNSTTGSFQLVYRLARRFTLRAQSGDDNSLDLIWTWRWQ